MPVTAHPACRNLAAGDRIKQSAARFMQVLTVAETAMAEEGAELDETVQQIVLADMGQAELTNTGRIDQIATVGEVKQAGGGGGMRAFAGQLGKRAHAQGSVWQQGIDQR